MSRHDTDNVVPQPQPNSGVKLSNKKNRLGVGYTHYGNYSGKSVMIM